MLGTQVVLARTEEDEWAAAIARAKRGLALQPIAVEDRAGALAEERAWQAAIARAKAQVTPPVVRMLSEEDEWAAALARAKTQAPVPPRPAPLARQQASEDEEWAAALAHAKSRKRTDRADRAERATPPRPTGSLTRTLLGYRVSAPPAPRKATSVN